ncbi:MAG: hypothetical protein IK018_08460 [Lachnospiraceae bacterium]|nr:hypothetical protein [Lachnospiraceae bacterium]MBR5993824.1 hypothetical protein [Lachnospiraceae bacterium]
MEDIKKVKNIPMNENLYSREYCKQLAHELTDGNIITGMTLGQLSCEIFAHAYVYYNFHLLPRFMQNMKAFKSFYHSVSDGVDLEDCGDKWYRRLAYRFIWILPAFKIRVQ